MFLFKKKQYKLFIQITQNGVKHFEKCDFVKKIVSWGNM